jgi:hypothetical protein
MSKTEANHVVVTDVPTEEPAVTAYATARDPDTIVIDLRANPQAGFPEATILTVPNRPAMTTPLKVSRCDIVRLKPYTTSLLYQMALARGIMNSTILTVCVK